MAVRLARSYGRSSVGLRGACLESRPELARTSWPTRWLRWFCAGVDRASVPDKLHNVRPPEAADAPIGEQQAKVGGVDSPAALARPLSTPASEPSTSAGGLISPANPKQRHPGSPQFSDLVYALGRALGTQASVYQVSELAGLNRGDLEDGFVNAPTRWYAALKVAVESGLEASLCREALRASHNRELRNAVTAYLS